MVGQILCRGPYLFKLYVCITPTEEKEIRTPDSRNFYSTFILNWIPFISSSLL